MPYWYLISYNNAGGGKTLKEGVSVTAEHPFQVLAKEIEDSGGNGNVVYNIVLQNWKEITPSEYKLFKKLFNT